jgi:hypothetical protein
MANEPIPEPLQVLLMSAIESVERLETLLLLRRERPRAMSVKAVSAARLVTPASAERDLALLCGRGFLAVNIGVDLVYSYRPVTPELDAQLETIERLWTERRTDVVRVLGERNAHDPVRAFADAFRIVKRRGSDG